MLASQNQTTIDQTCIDGQVFLDSEGDHARLSATFNCHLSANAPVMVVQHVSVADTAVTTLVSPVEQYVQEVVVHPLLSCAGDFSTVTLVATDQINSSVSLQWIPVADDADVTAGYLATASLNVVSVSSKVSMLTGIVYFLNDACSYGYNAGYDLSPLPGQYNCC